MAIPYKSIRKRVPSENGGIIQYFPCPVRTGETGFRQLAKMIAERCTVTSADAIAVLESLIQLIPEQLMEGRSVRLGEFGIFSLSLKSTGQTEEKNVTRKCITATKMNFLAGTQMKQKLKNASFKKRRTVNAAETSTNACFPAQETPVSTEE